MFKGISLIDLTLAFWEELKGGIWRMTNDDWNEDEDKEMNLADVVGDGRGSEVLDGQAGLAVP